MCACEKERERSLWGDEPVKVQKGQGWRKAKIKERKTQIPVKIID